jgi:DHA2 family metal-tetracycline-proton antiporter-like MFS transporter
MAAVLIFVSFQLLSSFVGVSPYFIAFILIVGSMGNTFLQVAMTNTISQTLTDEQSGMGTGFFYMMNLLAGATAASVIGKTLDFETHSFHLNPIPSNAAVFGYSNLFFGFAMIAAVVGILYFIQFGSASKKTNKGIFIDMHPFKFRRYDR